MRAPRTTPIGLQLGRVAKNVSAAFDAALSAAGGSLPIWLILLNLKINESANQRRIADAVGIREATLTHHLGGMEQLGLITRQRDPENRRTHVLALTTEGEALFLALREAAMAFDRRLRRSMTAAQVSALAAGLDQLAANVADRSGMPS
jgi:MarR family transcriptional regulator, transcriptional regulator for hemolysin